MKGAHHVQHRSALCAPIRNGATLKIPATLTERRVRGATRVLREDHLPGCSNGETKPTFSTGEISSSRPWLAWLQLWA